VIHALIVLHPNCNILADIAFPNSPGPEYYGYHNDIVTVTKNGEDESVVGRIMQPCGGARTKATHTSS
jgi:hypothetical protein